MLLSRQFTRRLDVAASAVSHPLTRARPLLAVRPHALGIGVGAGAALGQPLAARRGIHLIDVSIQVTQDLISGLHVASHTPWFLTIPLVALAVQLFRWPFQAHSARVAVMQAKLQPLLTALVRRLALDSTATLRGLPPGAGMKALKKNAFRARRGLYRRLGVQSWKVFAFPLASLPIWLAVSESLRRMSGGGFGLLGLLSSKSPILEVAHTPTEEASRTAVDAASSSTVDALSASVTVSSPDAMAAVAETATSAASSVDYSLAAGGCLWFPDLMAPDPYHILPFLYSFLIMWSITPTPKEFLAMFGNRRHDGDTVKSRTPAMIFKRSMFLAAMVVGPVTMGLPSSIHLYWVSSFMIGQGFRVFLGPKASRAALGPNLPLRLRPSTGKVQNIVLPRPPQAAANGAQKGRVK